MLRADLDRISHAIFHEYQIQDQCHVSDTSATRRVGDSPGAQAASRTADSARVLRTHAMPLPAGIGRVAREDADRGNHRPVACLWLYYYEVWHTTGEWLGGGLHPSARRPRRRA